MPWNRPGTAGSTEVVNFSILTSDVLAGFRAMFPFRNGRIEGVCVGEMLTCPCERQSEREPSSEGSVGGLALKSGRAVCVAPDFFCKHPRGRVPLVAGWSLAVPVLGAAILTPLPIQALSQPLRPGPWTAEFGALRPPHSGPVVSCQPAKPERPGASGSPGLGLAQPALRGPRRARGASCGPKRGSCTDAVAESDQGAAGTLSPSRWPPGLSLVGGPRNPDFRNQDQDGSRGYLSES